MASQPQYVLVSLLLGIIIQTNLVALSALIAAACGLHVQFRVWLLVWPLAKLLALVPLTLGGLGIREAGLVALLAPFGAPATWPWPPGWPGNPSLSLVDWWPD